MTKIRDDQGNVLDATFSVETDGASRWIVYESRSGAAGSVRVRNRDYFRGLELLLSRLREAGGVIGDILVDSRKTKQLGLSADERRLGLVGRSYPVHLRSEPDVQRFRQAVTAAQRSVAREPGSKPGGGNNHKRIRLGLAKIDEAQLGGKTLTKYLAGE